MRKKALIVDDEKLFLTSLKEGLKPIADDISVDISFSVAEAIKKTVSTNYDLVITDIRMPDKSGIDLLLFLKNSGYSGKLMVMTAYNDSKTFDVIKSMGIVDIIYKPFKLNWFKDMLIDFHNSNKPVVFESIDLMTVLQIINLEKKTAEITVRSAKTSGSVFFVNGDIYHAVCGSFKGEKAIMKLISLKNSEISVMKGNESITRTINIPFVEQMMQIMKLIDELRNKKKQAKKSKPKKVNNYNKENKMAIKETLSTLKDVSGYLGAGVFTPQGELLEGEADASGVHFETSGSMIHDTLLNAQKMSDAAGFGKADMIQVDTEAGLLFCKCFNDNASKHFHTILVLKKDGNVAMAKMKLNKAVSNLVAEF